MFKEDGQGDYKIVSCSVYFILQNCCGHSVFSIHFLEYAQVSKMLGNGRLEAMCFDGARRLCHIRGKLRKKVCYVESFSFDGSCTLCL